jgi:hypothetical protein
LLFSLSRYFDAHLNNARQLRDDSPLKTSKNQSHLPFEDTLVASLSRPSYHSCKSSIHHSLAFCSGCNDRNDDYTIPAGYMTVEMLALS